MTIDFVEIIGEPHINGIEIIYIGPPIVVTPPTTPTAPIKAPTKLPTKVPTKFPTKIPTRVPVPVPAPVTVPTSGNIVHRINCGTTKQVIVPPDNIVWTPDQFSTVGQSYNTCGSVTTSIYCTSRFFRTVDVTTYRYDLPVAVSNRIYQVRLHFAEQVRFGKCGVCGVLFLSLAFSLSYSFHFAFGLLFPNRSTINESMHVYLTYLWKVYLWRII
jgi:Malectin domain